MEVERRARIVRRASRAFVIVAGVLGAIAAILAFVPCVEVYQDARDCFGDALGRLFSWHGGGRRTPCEPHWVLVETRGPTEHPLGTLGFLAVVLLPGVLIWKRPRLLFALLWTPWAIIATGLMLAATLELDLFSRTRTVRMLPADLFSISLVGLIGALIVIVPIGCLVLAIATRKRPPPPPVFPTARIVER